MTLKYIKTFNGSLLVRYYLNIGLPTDFETDSEIAKLMTSMGGI